MRRWMAADDTFRTEQSPFGRVTLAAEHVPGLAVFFTGADFQGRLGNGVAQQLVNWIRERFSIDASLFTCHQVHGTTARRIEPAAGWQELESCDAIWSEQQRSALAIKVADCVAVLVADLQSGVTSAFHAGWRGAASGIATSTLKAVTASADFRAERARAWIGPAIRSCCFEVGEEVIEGMRALPTFREAHVDRERGQRPYLDLPAVVKDELVSAGVPPAAILDAGVCTRCSEEFHSYRRDPSRSGRNLAVIAADRERIGRSA